MFGSRGKGVRLTAWPVSIERSFRKGARRYFFFFWGWKATLHPANSGAQTRNPTDHTARSASSRCGPQYETTGCWGGGSGPWGVNPGARVRAVVVRALAERANAALALKQHNHSQAWRQELRCRRGQIGGEARRLHTRRCARRRRRWRRRRRGAPLSLNDALRSRVSVVYSCEGHVPGGSCFASPATVLATACTARCEASRAPEARPFPVCARMLAPVDSPPSTLPAPVVGAPASTAPSATPCDRKCGSR